VLADTTDAEFSNSFAAPTFGYYGRCVYGRRDGGFSHTRVLVRVPGVAPKMAR
jgi:hypothetical protein